MAAAQPGLRLDQSQSRQAAAIAVGRPDGDRLALEPVVQVVGQRLGGRVAVRGVLLQGLEDHRLQVAVQGRGELTG